MAISVQYGSTVLPNVFGGISTSNSYDRFKFSCDFLIKGSSKLDLVNQYNTITEALREPFLALVVSFDGNTEENLSHSANSYLLSDPGVVIVDGNLNTATTRHCKFVVNAELPADKSGFGFRRDATFSIAKGKNNRRIVTFSMTYTAGSGNSSLDNYDANAIAFATTILSSIGDSTKFELITDNPVTEHEKKITNGTLIYQEVLDSETSGTFNSSDLVDVDAVYSADFVQTIGVTSSDAFGAPVAAAIPTTNVSITYSAEVNKETVNTDSAFETLYRSTVKPFIVGRAFDILGLGNYEQAGSTFIVTNDSMNYSRANSRIAGNLSFLVPQSLTDIIALEESIRTSKETGRMYVKIWDQKDNTYNRWNRGSEEFVFRNIRVSSLGEFADPNPLVGESVVRNLELVSSEKSISKRRVGVGTILASNDDKISEVTVTETSIREFYRVVDSTVVNVPEIPDLGIS